MIRLAPEGYPFIIVSGALSAAALAYGGLVFGVPLLLLALFMVFFFRDPERKVPPGENVFVAPADGKIVLIREVFEPAHLKSGMKEISIFMSPSDVHVNRAPCGGKVKEIKHNKGGFLAAYKEEASLRNENIEMVLETRYGDILVRQVAGFLARRAVCRKRKGDVLKRGERYGMIKFSSRVDTYLPESVDVKVRLNDKVKAGETILAVLTE
jgi:phosphatidylserine decarboxylase